MRAPGQLIFVLSLFLLTHADEDDDNGECLEKTTPNCGISDTNPNFKYVIDKFTVDGDDPDDCARKCCARASECNATVFEKLDGEFICTLLNCKTYEECDRNWEENMSSQVAEIVRKQETEAERKQEEYMEELLDPTADIDNVTWNETALFEEEQEEIEEQFEEAFGPDIDELLDDKFFTDDFSNEDATTTAAMDNDRDWDNAWDDWVDEDEDEDEDSNDWDDWVDGSDEDEEDNEGFWDESSDEDSSESSSDSDSDSSSSELDMDKDNDDTDDGMEEINSNVYNSHSNNGMYGPSPIDDLDYNAAPFIVLGVVASILFILLVLIFVARKLGRTERLKYRPLSESFPSNTPYHDGQYAQYHDIE